MLRVPVFLCLLACGVCDSSPVRHRRPIKGFVNDQSNLLDKRAVHGWRTNGDPQQRLLDLSGVYRGTWTKLQDPHHSSSSNSVDPLPVLLHSGSGPLLLHLTTGPRHPHEDTAAVQGVLQLSQGSLSVGRSLQEQLTLSGLTRLNKHENVQEIHALLQSQHTLGSQQNTGTSSSSSMQEGDQQPPASLAHWIRHKQQRRQQQQQQWMKLPPTKHQVWLRGRRGPGVPVSPRGPRTRFQGPLTSGSAGGTAVEALGPGPDFDTDIDTDTDSNTNTAVGADKEHSSSSSSSSSADWDGPHRSLSFSESGTSGVKCRFRLQLAVTASAQQQVAAAAAVLRDFRGGRSMKAARDQDLNDVEDLDDVEDLEGSIKDQQQQQLDVGDGETAVDDVGSSSEIMSLYRLRQQHAVGLMQVLKQQQQQQHVVLDRSGSGDLRMRSVDKYYDGMRDEKMQQQLIAAAAAAAVINQGYDSSAAAPHTDHPQLPPLDQIEVLKAEALAAGTDSSSSNGGGQHTLRALHSRSFPGFVELGNDIDTHKVKKDQAAAAADQNLAMQDKKLISDDHDEQDAESSSQSQPTAAAAAVYSSIGPETRQAPQSLIDYWVLPCSHPQQQHTPRCWQQRQQQQRLMIQGLLLSDNCNASWSLTAVALPPGGLEHQATCYAVGALLLCVLQVIALRRQARAAATSPAAALKVSLLGVCGGAQLDACLSMAHLAAALAAADVSVPLLVVAAAQFAIFAGADMTLMLHVWRAHHSSSRRQRQQRQQQQQQVFGTAATAAAAAGGLVLETELVAAPLLQVGWSRSWTTAMAAVAAAAAAQLQEQADGLRGFMHSSSGSSLIDALLSGLVQLLTGQSLLLLYIRFYLVLLAVVVISWLLVSQLPLLLLLAFSMWLPQLLHNIQHSTKQALLPAYIVAATAARIMLPLYLLSCPSNMFQTTPQPLLAGGLLVWVGFQVLLLLLQHCRGPHVLLPHSWTPERYNYHRIELPWQFKQQLAEMRKLEQWQQQQHGTDDTAAAAAAAAAGSSSLGVVACQCHCDQFVTGAGRTVWDLHNRQAAAVDSWQQHWCRAAAAAAGSGPCCCRCRCIHDQSITTAFSPTSARPLYRVSSSSSSNHWQSCGSNALVPVTQQQQQQQQQQHAARFSWAAGCTDSSSTQERLGSGGYCSDACYISMLGAAAAAALAAPAASSTLHEPQRQQRHSSTPYLNTMHNLTQQQQQQQQQQRCCCHSYCPHRQPATTAVVSPLDSYNTTQNAAASSSSSILAPSGCVSSPQAWPDCQASSEDSLLHDVVESYDAVSGQGFVECVICMAAVSLLPAAGRCVTPCGHFFHTECLASWIEVKAECPTCRGPLPPLG